MGEQAEVGDREFRAAEESLAEFLERVEAGEPLDFDAWCAEHAAIEGELRRLMAEYEELRLAWMDGGSAPTSPLDPDAGDSARLVERERAEALLARLRALGARPRAGRTLGLLGRGGMGEVWAVEDPLLRRELAKKVLRRDGLDPARAARRLARFLEEAQVMGQLDHPAIVPVHELGLDGDGEPYFTMKRVRGRTLASELEELHAAGSGSSAQRVDAHGGPTLTRCLVNLQRVCEALAYAHGRGVIHRDLKPANVMLGDHGEVYVMDWGLARLMASPAEAGARESGLPVAPPLASERGQTPPGAYQTRDGEGLGTPAYMPPEQAAGRWAQVDGRADVYAAGAMLYHMLSGRTPYTIPGRSVDARVLRERVLAGPPEPLAQLAPRAPAELVAIAERAMHRDLDRRYRSMGELAADLRAFLEQRVVHAYHSGPWAEARMWMRRNRAAAAAGLALLGALLATIVVGFLWLQEKSERAVLAARISRSDLERMVAVEVENARHTLAAWEPLRAEFDGILVESKGAGQGVGRFDASLLGLQSELFALLDRMGCPLTDVADVSGTASRFELLEFHAAAQAQSLREALFDLRMILEVTRVGHAARIAQGHPLEHLKQPETRQVAEQVLGSYPHLARGFQALELLLDELPLTQGERRVLEVVRARFDGGHRIPPLDEIFPQGTEFDPALGSLLHFVGAGERRPEFERLLDRLVVNDSCAAPVFYELGVLLLREDRIEEAIPHLRRAVDLRPGWAPGRNQLAVALLLRGLGPDVHEAAHQARGAVRSAPRWGTPLVNLSAALLGLKDGIGAREAATRALELAPGNATAYYNRARANELLGEAGAALVDCQRALDLRPEYPRALELQARLLGTSSPR